MKLGLVAVMENLISSGDKAAKSPAITAKLMSEVIFLLIRKKRVTVKREERVTPKVGVIIDRHSSWLKMTYQYQ